MKQFILWVVITLTQLSQFAAATDDVVPEPTQNTEVSYRLFRTQNIFTLLKLDTRTGQVWQLQWNTDIDKRFILPIFLWGEHPCPNVLPPGAVCHETATVLRQNGRVGRFTLYPTANIFTFVLLDQDTGSSWQVQWGEHRYLMPID